MNSIDREADDLDALRRALGQRLPPKRIWQRPYDDDDAHLRALVRLEPGAKPNVGHLAAYAEDLRYERELQKDLVAYALPLCLDAWRDYLRGYDLSCGGFAENFYPALVRVVNGVITARDKAAVSTFMRSTILAEIDDQQGLSYAGMGVRPYRWIAALANHGVLFPDIEQLWTAWWSVSTRRRAVASVQYLSCLAYDDTQNPVFTPWTRERGGGPPTLWEWEGHLYDHRWLAANVSFLRATLNPTTVIDVLGRAVCMLADEPERDVAVRVLAGANEHGTLLQGRCSALPQLFETEHGVLAWSEAGVA